VEMAILTPVLCVLPRCANQSGDLSGLRVAAEPALGKDERAVDTYLEDAAAALAERDRGTKLALKLRRQTGGATLVASNHAVEDLDAHLCPR